MRLWKRRPVEVRESQPFTDAVTQAVYQLAAGTNTGDPSALAALEAAAGLYARCFASAKIEAEPYAQAALRPSVRALIARDLIRRGESLHLLDVDAGTVELLPVGSWDVRGGWRERSWWYRLDTFGPSGNLTHFVPAAAAVHVRYAVDPSRPWLGISPLGWARATGTLAANLEQRLAEEAGAVVAHVVPVPQDGGDGEDEDPLRELKADVAKARGGSMLVETTAAGWGEGKASAPQADWMPRRLGANPPAVLQTLRADVYAAVLGACGVPPDLTVVSTAQGQREAFRRFLTTGLEPLGVLVAAELSDKLATPIAFDFSQTYAHDLAGRASAFQKLIASGMATTEALAISGLTIPADA